MDSWIDLQTLDLKTMDREIGTGLAANDANLIAEHLSSCAACTEVLESRKTLRRKVRGAADNVPVPASLPTRVRARLDSQTAVSQWNRGLLAAAALVILTVGGQQVFKRFSAPPPDESETALLDRLSAVTPPILKVGLQDHVHCARFRTYPAKSPTLEELTTQLGADFSGLVQIVQAHAPKGMKVIEAHHCEFRGRKYIHVVARQGEQLLSLVITVREPGEAFENDVRTVVAESGINLYFASDGDFRYAGFETPHYLVYLISNAGQDENLAAMRAMTPALKEVFRKVEI